MTSDPTADSRAPISAVANSRSVVAEELNLIVDAPAPPTDRSSRKARGVVSGSLAAAMLAIGDIVEPQRAEVGIESVADTDGRNDTLLDQLDFGGLPPLN